MPGLCELLLEGHFGATAIVGMTKNVGKTVTLNYLVNKLERAGVKVGLVSAGYDGERFDRLTLKEKPRIYAPAGALVATAMACFEAAEAELELLETATFSTPLGLVVLAGVSRPGLVELAGPAVVSGLRDLISGMFKRGASRVLVDGAINRLASASPTVTGATILATGAALGSDMETVIQKTQFRRTLFELPALTDYRLIEGVKQGFGSGCAALIHLEGEECLVEPVTAALPLRAGAQLAGRCRKETAALVFGGAVVDGVLEGLTALAHDPPAVIVHDSTRLFISPEVYTRYRARGGRVMVIKPIRLLAVTLNPTDPAGSGFEPRVFLREMTDALKPCPVFDLVLQG